MLVKEKMIFFFNIQRDSKAFDAEKFLIEFALWLMKLKKATKFLSNTHRPRHFCNFLQTKCVNRILLDRKTDDQP